MSRYARLSITAKSASLKCCAMTSTSLPALITNRLPLPRSSSLPISGVAGHRGWTGMWDQGDQDGPDGREVVDTLQTEPEGLGPGFAVALAPEKPAETRHHADRFPQGGRLGRWDGVFGDVRVQRFPLGLLEKDRAWNVGDFAAELGQVVDAPGHHHVDGQARFNAVGVAQLALFDPTAALEGAMIDLNAPPFGVPVQPFGGFREAGDRVRGQQHPAQRVDALGGSDLLRQDRP